MAGRLVGLVLAGGRSRRMGTDKALLEYRGEPQIQVAWRMLDALCAAAFVAVRSGQAVGEAYDELPCLEDDATLPGPAAGVLSAWRHCPGAALLVLAVDLPMAGSDMLETLIEMRDPRALATAFQHADGTIEPLCTIWEPRAHEALLWEAERRKNVSLRRLLERSPVRLVGLDSPERLVSVNSPEDYRSAVGALAASEPKRSL